MRPTHYPFVAIPESVKKQVEKLQLHILFPDDDDDDDDKKFRDLGHLMTNVSYLHLTLGLFHIYEGIEDNLTKIAESILKQEMNKLTPPHFDIELKGIGNFGGNVIFVEVEKSNVLMNLRRNIITEFKKNGIFLADERDYNPHITIFQMPYGKRCDDVERVKKAISKVNLPKFEKIRVNELHFSAILSAIKRKEKLKKRVFEGERENTSDYSFFLHEKGCD